MKKTLFVIACILISSITLQSCSSKDDKISREVSNILLREHSSMSATVKDGVVTLEGTAKTEEEKHAAEEEINNILNVKSVINNVVVQEPPISPEELDREANVEARVDAIMNEEKK